MGGQTAAFPTNGTQIWISLCRLPAGAPLDLGRGRALLSALPAVLQVARRPLLAAQAAERPRAGRAPERRAHAVPRCQRAIPSSVRSLKPLPTVLVPQGSMTWSGRPPSASRASPSPRPASARPPTQRPLNARARPSCCVRCRRSPSAGSGCSATPSTAPGRPSATWRATTDARARWRDGTGELVTRVRRRASFAPPLGWRVLVFV